MENLKKHLEARISYLKKLPQNMQIKHRLLECQHFMSSILILSKRHYLAKNEREKKIKKLCTLIIDDKSDTPQIKILANKIIKSKVLVN